MEIMAIIISQVTVSLQLVLPGFWTPRRVCAWRQLQGSFFGLTSGTGFECSGKTQDLEHRGRLCFRCCFKLLMCFPYCFALPFWGRMHIYTTLCEYIYLINIVNKGNRVSSDSISTFPSNKVICLIFFNWLNILDVKMKR